MRVPAPPHALKRATAAILATAVVLAVAATPARPAAALSRAEQWKARAETALAAYADADNGQGSAFAYAYAAAAYARLHGWDHPQVTAWIGEVYERRNPDGGWGLGFAYDTHSDGTTNSASTTYVVTLAGHVGPVLLEGYRAGAIPRADVKKIVDLLMSTPRIAHLSEPGQCLAYSRAAADNVAYGCVHNVSAGAAAFLTDANGAGVGAVGLARLVVDITRREVAAYIVGPVTAHGQTRSFWWRYKDTPSLQDADHNSYSAESMYDLAYPVGREVAWHHMTTAYADNPAAPIAHLRLAGLPPGPDAMHPVETDTTYWCVLGDQWWGELDAFIDAHSTDLTRMSQVAYYATANWRACGG